MRTNILIYQDYIHNHGLLLRAVKDHFDAVDFCDASDILNGILDESVALLIMPGGADLYYCEKLNGAGNAAIRSYVENGGAYLGICAGAYYACNEILWAAGTDQTIAGPRELKFHDGIATGPIKKFIQNGEVNQSWLAAAPVAYDDGTVRIDGLLAYEAGPVFSETPSTRVLARYGDGGAAMIEGQIGKGRFILSSPHIERVMPMAQDSLYAHRTKDHAYDRAVYDALAPHAAAQAKIWDAVLNRLIKNAEGLRRYVA